MLPPPAEKLQNFFGVFLQFHIGVDIFVGRYFYMDSLKEVAAYYGLSESKVKSMLYRMRLGLKTYLTQEGFNV